MRAARVTSFAILACALLGVWAGPAAAQQEAPAEPQYPRCFGAASRDSSKPCTNRELFRSVVPKPDEAILDTNSPCTFGTREGELTPCHFGVPPEQASQTIALIGDSHAAHWRAAIDALMPGRNWHGISMTKAGCPLSTAVSDLPEPQMSKCVKFKRQLFAWFERHPEVKTVITSNHAGGKVVGSDGRDFEAHTRGYANAIRRLLKTVQHVISIRDVPRQKFSTMECVDRAVRRKVNPGPACALPRSFALRRDPATEAAKALDPTRAQLIDLTRFMCSPRYCMPVIGGALVHKDSTHLTRVFATTLGPYLLRNVDRAYQFFAPS